jgi:hypothetical protein
MFIISTQTRIAFTGLYKRILKCILILFVSYSFVVSMEGGPSREVPIESIQAQVQVWDLNSTS